MMNELFVPSTKNPEIQTSYTRILERILHHEDTIQRLESALSAFDVRIKVAEKSNAASAHLARELCDKAMRIIALVKKSPGQEFVPHALAAIDYLVTENDGDPDFGSDAGFQDDADVLKDVIKHFNISL